METDAEYDLFVKDLIKKKLLNLPDQMESEPFIEKEIEFIKKSLLECFRFILGNGILRPPRAFNKGKIYRAGLLRDVDKSFIPLGKAISKNCGVKDDNEAVWFSSSNIDIYMRERIKNAGEKVYGIQTCKTFNSENQSSYFINLSSNITQLCEGKPTFLLNKYMQFLFNQCLIVPLIRNYSSDYAYNKKKEIEDFEGYTIFGNTTITIDKHVPGYPCTGTIIPTTIYHVLRAWDSTTGTRNSFLNEDRIKITLLFQLIDIFNQLLEYKKEKIKILGWTCENTPTSESELFHSELAIAIKYLQDPLRKDIFEEDNKDCRVKIIDPDIAGGKHISKKESRISPSVSSSRSKSDTHLAPIQPVDLTDPFNNYEDVPDTVPDKKIKNIDNFFFGNIDKIKKELFSESSAGGRKRKTTHRKATRRKRKRKVTRKHYK